MLQLPLVIPSFPVPLKSKTCDPTDDTHKQHRTNNYKDNGKRIILKRKQKL